MSLRSLLPFILCVCTAAANAQVSTNPTDGLHSPTKRRIAYVNCTAVVEPGTTIDSAVIIVANNRILSVGRNTSIPAGTDTRDLKGAWVYPAFVEPYADVKELDSTKDKDSQKSRPVDFEDDEDPNTPGQLGARHWNQAVRPEREPLDELRVTSSAAREWNKLGYGTASVASHVDIFSVYASTILLRNGSGVELALSQHVTQLLDFKKGSSKTPYPSSLMGSIALIRQTLLDAAWYGASNKARSVPTAEDPQPNISLNALYNATTAKTPFIAHAYEEHDVARWLHIGNEANISMIIVGSGKEYRRLAWFATHKPRMILPLTLPKVPDVRDPIVARDVPLTDLIHWYWAADNTRLLDSVGCEFAFTLNEVKDKAKMLSNLRTMVERGLDSNKALAALTTVPASFAGVSNSVGTIATNKVANFIVLSGPLFKSTSTIQSCIVNGDQTVVNEIPPVDVRGTWQLSSPLLRTPLTMELTGNASSPKITTKADSTNITSSADVVQGRITFTALLDSIGVKGTARGSAQVDSIMMKGALIMPDGSSASFIMRRDKPYQVNVKASTSKKKTVRMPLPPTLPLGPFGYDTIPSQNSIVLSHATVWTSTGQGTLYDADVAIAGGKIVGVGKGLTGGKVVDCTGKHITAGVMDEHSHIAITRGVNEGTHAVTTEVRIGDVLNPDDVNIYRQLAGGVTSTHLLHGSANPMGGQLQMIRMRWGADADGLKQQGVMPTVKFALGENVKQSNWGDRYTVRYPQTRMGVEEIMRDAFATAKAYEQQRAAASLGGTPVRRDLQLDALVEILNGKRNIHCHSYKASEILMLIRLAEEFGFKVGTFTHILEGYKVAREIKEHGAHASTFADWWAYKFEVYDAIPQNAAIMHEQGIVVGVNSDDAEMARRLNQEAAKSVSYGGVSEEDAIKFFTINPAIQMEMQATLGSLEVGKDADVVVWSANPLANTARVERTFVEGREMFSLDKDKALRQRDSKLRAFLEQEAIKAIGGGMEAEHSQSKSEREYHCDTIEDEMSGEFAK